MRADRGKCKTIRIRDVMLRIRNALVIANNKFSDLPNEFTYRKVNRPKLLIIVLTLLRARIDKH